MSAHGFFVRMLDVCITLACVMWLDVVKDYDCEILYHPAKANMVVDALSR